ncbi:unnamed protein product [Cuscuta campestris]|uniref:Phosphatidylinositol-specific phospholipase C X domain-containing protein n=1 Tax=Cuscuta campestris TaxID=132261 RepID=A0A484KN49_9ASTE|nr:unnamed protein product [Cuscuta campestris]
MGIEWSKQVERRKAIHAEKVSMALLKQAKACIQFPGSDFHPADRKNWMGILGPERLPVEMIVWPGTHDSATDKIGIPLVSRPFAQCQTLSVHEQLLTGARALDIRVQEDRNVCHGFLTGYPVDIVIRDVKRFLSETRSEIIIMDIRTEFGHRDPPGFDKYLEEKLGELLIPHDSNVFGKTIAEVLPKRIICFWKPRKVGPAIRRPLLWGAEHLKDNWTDTELPKTKFDNNINHLSQQPPVGRRKFFYRVENTLTPQLNNPAACVKLVTDRIHPYARLFITQCISLGIVDRLQVFSTDFIDEDFVDACFGLTNARIHRLL